MALPAIVWKVFVVDRNGESTFFITTRAKTRQQALNNARHRFCLQFYGCDVSAEQIWLEHGVSFDARPESQPDLSPHSPPPPKKPDGHMKKQVQGLLFPTCRFWL